MNAVPDLQALYRQTVLDHSRRPRNFRRLEPCDRRGEGHNPLCGDKLTIYLRLDDGRITEAVFEGTGCAICLASASIMTEAVAGESIATAMDRAEQISSHFHGAESDTDAAPELGDMAALSGVRAYPSRIKCALLAWKTLEAALGDVNETATTE